MRVLHVGKYFPPFAGGIEYFLSDLAAAQASCGMDAAVLVHDHGGEKRPTIEHSASGVSVYRAPSYGQLLYAPLSPSFPLWLDRAIRLHRPDLLHLHLPNTSALAALAVPAARRLPWIVHWHADVVASTIDPRLKAAYRLYRPFEQRFLARSEAIIVTSPPYLESSEALAGWRTRCAAIPLGLSPERIPMPEPRVQAAAERAWGSTDLRILAVGRLTYYKGFGHLLGALPDVPRATALIVGTGDLRGQLERAAARLELGERARFLGFQTAERLHALLASCDVLCLPSVERTEAFGLVQLEAMRFGKPVVVSDIPGSGIGWVARTAGNGLLCSPGDTQALAAALRALMSDRDRRGRLGEAGRLALEQTFGIAAVARRIGQLYADVLERRQPAALSAR